MKVSAHAGERFLQRVMKKSNYTCLDIDFAMRYLTKILQDVVPTSYAKSFVIPGFEHYRDNTVITIIQKGHNHV